MELKNCKVQYEADNNIQKYDNVTVQITQKQLLLKITDTEKTLNVIDWTTVELHSLSSENEYFPHPHLYAMISLPGEYTEDIDSVSAELRITPDISTGADPTQDLQALYEAFCHAVEENLDEEQQNMILESDTEDDGAMMMGMGESFKRSIEHVNDGETNHNLEENDDDTQISKYTRQED